MAESRNLKRLSSQSSTASKTVEIIPNDKSVNGQIVNTSKRRKINENDPVDKTAELIMKHNILLSELFNLIEYKSVLYWDPSTYSRINDSLPEIFREFVNNNPQYELSWSEDPEGDRKKLQEIPLRLQKRQIAAIENELKIKYPFKDDAIKRSAQMEEELLKIIDIKNKEPETQIETTTERFKANEEQIEEEDDYGEKEEGEKEEEEEEEVEDEGLIKKELSLKEENKDASYKSFNSDEDLSDGQKGSEHLEEPENFNRESKKPQEKKSVSTKLKQTNNKARKKANAASKRLIKNSRKRNASIGNGKAIESYSENENAIEDDSEEENGSIGDEEFEKIGKIENDDEEPIINSDDSDEKNIFGKTEIYLEDIDDDTIEIDSNYKLKEIKFTVAAPLITHPSHIPSWRPTLEDSMSSSNNNLNLRPTYDCDFKPIVVTSSKDGLKYSPDPRDKIDHFFSKKFKQAIVDESIMPDYSSTMEEYDTIMNQQIKLMKRLYQKVNIERRLVLNGDKIEARKEVLPQATNPKVIVDPFRANDVSLSSKNGQAVANLTHEESLLQHGISFSKIHQQTRKGHQVRARKIAQMIESYFKKKAGEKERLDREREQNLKKISRLAVQAVKKRWNQANKVYKVLQQQEEEELKRIKGREHLSQMLEHSTQLLEQQLANPNEVMSDANAKSENNKSDNSFDSDDDLSSDSDSESDLESVVNDGDEKLTIDELKSKYKNIESLKKKEANESEDQSDDDIDVANGLASLYGNKKEIENNVINEIPTEYTDEQKKLIKSISEDKEMSILDTDNEDDSMDDSSSSNESENDTNEETNSKGLSSLFSKNELNDDSEDAEVDLDSSDNDENMTETTDDEEEPKTPKSNDSKFEKEIIKEEIINGSKVRDVPVPALLRGTLRPYQKQGLNWMAGLYNSNTNGILADEMGLGKTIQTISLLSYLACEHHVWGPHLIVVPTSVMLNWEMEFKKFAPGFKVLTYYGSPQQRAAKRKGWNKPDAFHVCITSYQLVVHDHSSFKRRKWKYMILDEAHNIKNFRSARWKALLNFNTENRLLLTGTPLQNNLIELWSLLYFLMPSSKVSQAMPDGFANLEDFQQWFGKPVDKILEQATSAQENPDLIDENESTTAKMDKETRNTVARLHQVLRPYLLRRLKKDVEQQMPGKYEHIVYCRLSQRQRYLYDDFMSRAKTKETLKSGNFLSIINCLMQLRKVCNHPDLFEVRPIVTSFAMPECIPSKFQPEVHTVSRLLKDEDFKNEVSLKTLNLDITGADDLNLFVSQSLERLKAIKGFDKQIKELDELIKESETFTKSELGDYSNYLEYYKTVKLNEQIAAKEKLKHVIYLNNLRCSRSPLYGESLLRQIKNIGQEKPITDIYRNITLSIKDRSKQMRKEIQEYSVVTPAVVAVDMKDQLIPISSQQLIRHEVAEGNIENPFHQAQVKLSIAFPDKSLLQYDCGKLQRLATLLQQLTAEGHRALIFTQMTKVLDILEQFLNIHGYRYMRLDGSTKIEDRQLMTEKFNRDNKIPVFILSTRSGGLGINLTGADTVIFYDSDWNPAMDKQCQDRCHRIGQSRDVHIYRFVSEYTIESNILRKANQKRTLDNVVIQEGEFTTEFFGKFSVKDIVGNAEIDLDNKPLLANVGNVNNMLAQAEDEEDRTAANAAMQEEQVDNEDFEEGQTNSVASETASSTPAPTQTDSNKDDVDFDEGVGHVDEYMLRFIADGNYWD